MPQEWAADPRRARAIVLDAAVTGGLRAWTAGAAEAKR